MELLFSLVTCHCFFAVAIQAQDFPDFRASIAELRSFLGISSNVSLVQTVISSGTKPVNITNNIVTSNNIVIRFELRVNGLPVYDAGVTAEFFPNGSFASLWTSVGADVIVSDNGLPRISPRQVRYILARTFNLCSFITYFQNEDYSLYYMIVPGCKDGRLIYRASAVLYGRVTSNGTTETIQPTALIDAITGEVIEKWNGITSQFPATTTILGFGGNDGNYVPVSSSELVVGRLPNGSCIYSTSDVQVENMQFQTNKTTFEPTIFECDDPKRDTYDNANGCVSPLNDAMKNAQTTIEMYRSWVTGFDVPHFELPVKLRVHYGLSYSYAFWDGKYINFGDSDSSTWYPPVTPGNVAHEIGHAYTSFGSRLEQKGHSGAINEAFSDMSGQAVVVFSGGKPNWAPGMEYTKSGRAVRYMDDPTLDGVSIDNYRRYKFDIDPHYACGLFNKAFYLLVNKQNWTLANTFQVFAFANRMLWKQRTTFGEAVCGVQNATRYLLGESSIVDVKSVFQKVGLKC